MLEIRNITLIKGDRKIIDDLSLTIKPNEIHGILGMNGTGKSTLAYTLMGLPGYKPSRGAMLWNSASLIGLSITERARRGITLAWQEPARFEGLAVKDYLRLSGRQANRPIPAEQALERVGLDPARYLDREVDADLSGGERKRIELAAVLANQPRLAILDEPDSGIDALSIDYIKDVIRELVRGGSAVMLITHHEEVAAVADRASALCGGRIIKTGLPEEVNRFFRNHCQECPHINEPNDEVS